MARLGPMHHFENVTVVPMMRLRRHVAQGGPIWPDFDTQIGPRQCRSRIPCDLPPERPDQTRAFDQPAVWCGTLDHHFGHVIAEHMSRLPQSLAQRPDDFFLFILEVGRTRQEVPDWIWQILDWYGVPRAQIHIVTEALQVQNLSVAPQAEMLGAFDLQEAYLDLLDLNTQRHNLAAIGTDVTYVTRAGLVANGWGGHAGEGYLVDVLTRLGVHVIDPSQMAIAAQMAVYAGAKSLIFAEGSAIYGRNLLGRIAQDIHILRRRGGRDLGAMHLAKRCRDLQFHAAARRTLVAQKDAGQTLYHRNVALYNLKVVFALFHGLGYDLAAIWDDAAYHEAVRLDLIGWMENCPSHPDRFLKNLDILTDAGFQLEGPMPLPQTLPHGAQPV